MTTQITIRPSTATDIPHLVAIEAHCTEKFQREAGITAFGPSETSLRGYRAMDSLWVAALVESQDKPIGYVAVDSFINDEEHWSIFIAQVSVHPRYAGQAIGRKLVEHVEEWCKGLEIYNLDLTTFEHVPWNCKYWSKLGFQVLSNEELMNGDASDVKAQLQKEQARRGDESGQERVAMRKVLKTTE
ncbi:acyl-CoA N-acyltransferase [Clohesyomyces aquaticus]|uniref:Acyl-CoA N-acyltransferase n=1 Tax=Clohesyomyces aquaticus TaxID=1231657 RepID=A0A1Y1ZTI1_9PLEO|nr:acyl-CoA N-acyltransferase [Clohesyomyces aquaticus]